MYGHFLMVATILIVSVLLIIVVLLGIKIIINQNIRADMRHQIEAHVSDYMKRNDRSQLTIK